MRECTMIHPGLRRRFRLCFGTRWRGYLLIWTHRPTAIVAASDVTAFGVIETADSRAGRAGRSICHGLR